MTLTVVVGSEPGSGKTELLNDIYKKQECIYIRQNYAMRPYITVKEIRNFDPTELPYWGVYQKEGTADSIKVGGSMAGGEQNEGLAEGQRKLLNLEIICQRTEGLAGLLILLDEPLAGMTDDIVPYFLDSLSDMRHRHNIVIASSLHVEELIKIANNVITVSAIDCTVVRVNSTDDVDRKNAVNALAVGNNYTSFASLREDFHFFFDVEILSNKGLLGLATFALIYFILFIAALWNSEEGSAPLVLIAGGLISYATVYHHLVSFVEWRNVLQDEAEALVHGSKRINKILKTVLMLIIITIISVMQFCVVNTVINGLSSAKYWVAMLFDSISLALPFICLGLFTKLSSPTVRVIGSLPLMLMILFSTTFSPGSGVPMLKELRYLFTRFYFWCMVPSVDIMMEGCPQDEFHNILYMVLSAFTGLAIFLCPMAVFNMKKKCMKHTSKDQDDKPAPSKKNEFVWLQTELHGVKASRYFPDATCRGDEELQCSKHSNSAGGTDSNSECSRHSYRVSV